MERPSKEAVEGALAHYAEDAQCAIERNCAGILAAEVRALREELASENSEARRIFTKEFQAELLERTQECDRLREERAWCGTNHGNNMCPVGLQKVRELQATIARVEACLDECAQTEGADETYVYVYAVHDALRGQP